jgi:hypothetical protein
MTEHLIRTLARETQVSAMMFDQPDIMRFVTEELTHHLHQDAQRYRMTITKMNIRTNADFTIDEDGVMHKFYRVAAVAQGYMPDESVEQALRKIDIDNASSEYFEDDD